MKDMFNEPIPEAGLPWPNDVATFERAKLPWGDFEADGARAALARFRELAGWRREKLWPLISSINVDSQSYRIGDCLLVSWEFETGTLSMALNPTDRPADLICTVGEAPVSTGTYTQTGDLLRLGAWSAVVW